MNGSTVLPGIIAGALIQRLKIWPGGNLKGPHCRPGRSFRPVSRMSKGNRTMNASAVTRISRFIVAGLLMYHSAAATGAAQPPYTLEQVVDYAFPSELVASPVGSAVAWAVVLWARATYGLPRDRTSGRGASPNTGGTTDRN
jgi:hypothetical protein